MTSSALPIRDHFSTDHLLADLKGRSVRGGAVTLAAQGIKFALQMGSTMVLARLLTPNDFGLIAMVVVVTGFAAMFKDAGLSMATVQREHITHEQVSTLFWINVALSVLIMVAVASLAPAVAWFYDKPQLTWITLALASTFIFSGLTVQHQALLRRQMRFRALAVIEILSLAVGIATGITMAVLDFGFWSLVGMAAGMAVSNCVLVWLVSGWRPGRPVRGSGVRPMLGFGAYLSGSSLMAYLRRNLDNVLIGATWGAGTLGVYAKAYGLLMLPLQQVNAPVSAVVVPALSRLQGNRDKYRQYYRKALLLVTSMSTPIVGFAFVSADVLVLVILGEQWREAIPIFLALAPAAFAGTLDVAGGWVYVSSGRTDRLFRANIASTLFISCAIVGGLPWGALGVAVAFSLAFCIERTPIIWYAFRETTLSLRDVGAAIWRPCLATVIAGSATLVLVRLSLDLTLVIRLFANLVFFAGLYVLSWRLLPGGARATQLLEEVISQLVKRKK